MVCVYVVHARVAYTVCVVYISCKYDMYVYELFIWCVSVLCMSSAQLMYELCKGRQCVCI